MFALLQTMHYVVWVGFLPRYAPEAAAAFDARVPWLRGRRAWIVGIAGGSFFAVLFLSDYFAGRALYGAGHLPRLSGVPGAARLDHGAPRPEPVGRTGGCGAQAFFALMISLGLFGRPVPSGLLPSWPSPAMVATTSRDAASRRPKIV